MYSRGQRTENINSPKRLVQRQSNQTSSKKENTQTFSNTDFIDNFSPTIRKEINYS
jgi:hypothetical protein